MNKSTQQIDRFFAKKYRPINLGVGDAIYKHLRFNPVWGKNDGYWGFVANNKKMLSLSDSCINELHFCVNVAILNMVWSDVYE